MEKIVVGQKTNPAVIERLREAGKVTVITSNDLSELREACMDADALQIGTWTKIDGAFMDDAPKLKVIARTGVGVDSVDVDAATKRGIYVVNAPVGNIQSVAEHAISQMCCIVKRLGYMDAKTREGQFASARREYKARELEGMTFGVLGYGNIGKLAARMANAAFGMPVLAYDPFVTEAPDYVTLCATADEVMKNADVVSVHLPLLPDTRGMINAERIAEMKEGAYLVCTSRGGIVDEDALAEALETGHLAGAALDVFEKEPPELGRRIMQAPNLIVSPHCGGLTKEAVVKVAMMAADGIVSTLKGEVPKYLVNRKALGL